ncbi:PBP1A family penicillin-binding protein [Parvularcula dongshanensis]|uniref:Penicillin-binding protein 1A n=1 Tax=Parvularcula dongshanensis TaxID=1173995 RepID=A0A840HZ04_9PROT|nr:penicillin-binding protein 1A [Parvularcula dongshanensis]
MPRIEVRDRTGALIAVHGRDKGAPVDPATLPPHVIQAFLATEDRNFYDHVGVNPVAVLRALLVNTRAGGVAQGGSTITQQLVKNALLTSDRTLKRKAQEVILALKIERAYDKDEILGFYLNTVYFGSGAYGLEAASRRYFDHAPTELTVGEAAMLAGLLKAPSRYAPTRAPDAARNRAGVVLAAMVDAGYLTASQAERIEAEGIASVVPRDDSNAYGADAAVAEARRVLGGIGRNVVVTTTLDAAAGRGVAQSVEDVLGADPRVDPAVEAAVLLAEEDGAIRVMIGGRDYARSTFNRATLARRQPGSVFKPFVYLAGLESGLRPESIVDDSPIRIGTYAPDNYKDRYYGEVSLTEAMARSLNAAAVRVQEEAGRSRVVSVARRAGLSGASDTGPALALGVIEATPVEILQSYATLSTGGVPSEPYLVTRIATPDGRVLYEHRPPPPGLPVFAERDMVALGHMLQAVVHSGSGVRAAVPGHLAAGKTGTGQDSRDAWFAGYASGLVGVVWLGRDDFGPMEGPKGAVTGAGAPAVLWSQAMRIGLEGRPARDPVPYAPEPDEKSLFEHLAALLTRRSPDDDQIADLIQEIRAQPAP